MVDGYGTFDDMQNGMVYYTGRGEPPKHIYGQYLDGSTDLDSIRVTLSVKVSKARDFRRSSRIARCEQQGANGTANVA